METIQVQTSHNVTIDYHLASLGDRMIATFLDYMVQYAYIIMVSILLGLTELTDSIPVVVMCILPFVFYPFLCEVLLNGQSVGKRALDIRVIRLDGNTPTIGGYFLRWLFGLLEVQALPFVAILTIIVRGQGQRLGDTASGTCVVKVKKYVRLQATSLHRGNRDYAVSFPQVTQLNDRDINIIKEVIFTFRRNKNLLPLEAAAQKVKGLLGITSDLPLAKFLETIVRDYNFLTSDLLVK
jgi:uncharacterized RDD family membrane protein YckC